jgi:hypothetical protein
MSTTPQFEYVAKKKHAKIYELKEKEVLEFRLPTCNRPEVKIRKAFASGVLPYSF